ncbi:MAG: magnesium transporter [Armatimonadota bacterium]|nr:magnesium transporter [Armatimonadota bacterium]MDW8157201.1 magnesium transporter [Armatimonadota bacterium]
MTDLAQRLRESWGDPQRLRSVIRAAHPADLAEALEGLPDPELLRVLEVLGAEAAGLFEYLPPDRQRRLLRLLPPEVQARILEGMSRDDAADLLGALGSEEAQAYLQRMSSGEAQDVQQLMGYAPESAGGRMSTEVVTVSESWTAGEALEHLRRLAPSAETVYYVYVVDAEGRLRGVVGLRDLIVAEPQTPISAIADRKVVAVQAEDDQETVAQVFQKYSLLALPVVDRAGRLLGVVTVDDVLDVVQEEATEDAYRLTGLSRAAVELEPSPWRRALRRLPWLLTLMVVELLAGSVVGGFEHALKTLVVLAFFIPMLNDQAGNMGIQTVVFTVRAVATGRVHRGWYKAFLLREVVVGLAAGALSAGVAAAIGWLWWHDLRLSAVLATTVFTTMNVAALLGVLIPLGLMWLGRDPAVASGPFITSLMDVVTVTVYFAVATAMFRLAG